MGVPKYNEFMLPFLKELKDGQAKPVKEVREKMAKVFNISEGERRELLPSGNQSIFKNRVGWAKTYLKKAGLLEYPDRGAVLITLSGQKVLSENPKEIDRKFLSKFEDFQKFQNIKRNEKEKEGATLVSLDPLEQLELNYRQLRNNLKEELLEIIMSCGPDFFEKLVIDLLINLGYGGFRKEAGKAFKKTNDEGIDGLIKEDKLGLDVIYVQAKRWRQESSVGRPEIQKFAGALQGKRAKKGVFIITSYFTKEAREFVGGLDSKIILIDKDSLTDYMIESNTGVSTSQKFEIKKLDQEYFD